ncbi:hypothetical protein RFI_39170 [Reticulomyxa filosa]|uniref:Uncharacterized protein n=1 Tax=Reticulomyxa filosa TaxID=46433 RepID=X6L9Z0_RETFI|nr:hypothetical protein RFI_39170 [Reticulomyxa filosa]|eukprot:ETN98343.1 hypothetical protein RFI_39170 [Reticulomyxa filosa]
MTSQSHDDVEEQMRQRRLREEARREKHLRESSADNNKMDVDVDPRISELERSINARKQKISHIQAQIDELQQEYRTEVAQCQKEEDDLKQLQGIGDNNEERNDSNNVRMNETTQSNNNSGNESNANNQNQQVMTDEELARHLAAQFEREEQEQESI